MLIVFQTEESGYHARSFEDAFFHVNRDFLVDSNNFFSSVKAKYLEKFKKNEVDSYGFSAKAVISKPSFAIEVLINSKKDENGNEFSNWQIPAYIKEGLIWLKQD